VKFTTTCVYEQNAAAWLGGKRRAFNEGGTSSSKTWSILELLILITSFAKSRFLASVVSESMPHLKRGCIRDFEVMMEEDWEDRCWNKTDKIYDFNLSKKLPGHGILEFFSADQPAKLRGGRRKVLFCNEANNLTQDAFQELDVRTELFTFADWNPVSEFWYHQNPMWHTDENVFIHSSFADVKDVLPPEIVAAIMARKDNDPNWFNIYGLGLLGKVVGLVYPKFGQVDELPKGGVEFYSVDFGFSSDPAVVEKHVVQGDNLYSQQLIYEVGLTNDVLCDRMLAMGIRPNYDEIWADAAEPKSIEEIHRRGHLNIKGTPKGADSVEFGHQKVRQFNQFWTKDSLDCIKEQRNFRYIEDKDGKLTDKTTHLYSHGMDARRYGVVGATLVNSANSWKEAFEIIKARAKAEAEKQKQLVGAAS